ncbi:D-alanyl-D-alanine carboxypeptidase DacA [Halolactibacillus miurensis]|uniref:serine-type D-Ala-D-Ala carboxypeptidase n=1 Tax=Halolactibacillus miurensis TaxID=306541 RepID=A0A1I6UY46_9BACI|nr:MULTISPECIES: D-alanyl-D-alanine carboxypeptidase family protein [Halolactibacillus]GEM05928.1 D-alanyl-D-alanine carboxypeptidase DacA [Halolactibacillus miurensis]SFT06313.1 D-alanyl-D-alanine carboxypeptidase (penicillin-binding protein 5/6) [Halolactibacillus miurensis]
MKRLGQVLSICLMALLIGLGTSIDVSAVSDLQAESGIIVDAKTGDVLFSKNVDIKLPPASMTKMMTEYLVLEAIEEGKITWETTTQISDYAYSISADTSFSGIGLRQSQDYTVRQLYEAMAIISDNATTIALAELVSGSESEFVKLMNQKGEELGLKDFKFVNSTGLNNKSLGDNRAEGTGAEEDNLMSARATATLAFHLVNDYPEVLEFSSTIRSELDGQPLENLNWMLPWNNDNFAQYYFEGADGLKTGYTSEAGYSFAGTALRGDQRFITVVMRTDSYGARFEETIKLMNYGFNEFTDMTLFNAGDTVEGAETLPVSKGKEDNVNIALKEDMSRMVKNEEADLYSLSYTLNEDMLDKNGALVAPIEAGTVVGKATLVYSGEENYGNIDVTKNDKTVDLVTTNAVEKDNWFMLVLGVIGDFFVSLYQTVADTVTGWF